MFLLLGYGIANKSIAKYFDKELITYKVFDDNKEIFEEVPYKYCENDNIDIVIKSSGINPEHFLVQKFVKQGKMVITDLELFYMFKKDKKIIVITGTNGKSTVVSLLKTIIRDIDLGGNIGYPLFDFIDSKKDIIIEASSYMGEFVHDFKPDYGGITNLNISHLSHHKTYENYKQAKRNIFMNMDENDCLVYDRDNKELEELFSIVETNKYSYKNVDYMNNYINIYNDNDKLSVMIALKYGISREIIAERIKLFKGLEHRIEYINSYKGIDIYNDSKSTNFYALNYALKLFSQKKLVLICGGKIGARNRKDWEVIVNYENVQKVFLFGESVNYFKEFFDNKNITNYCFNNLQEVIKKLFGKVVDSSNNYEIILFSPGCESFDQYRNFEERGKEFKKLITSLQLN